MLPSFALMVPGISRCERFQENVATTNPFLIYASSRAVAHRAIAVSVACRWIRSHVYLVNVDAVNGLVSRPVKAR
jgi:hypothetical protein